jgi:transcriptional regulator with XRE-family HTH domain
MGESEGSSPAVQRRRLRAELRRVRQEAGETQEQVAVAMDWSLSKLIRIENGSVGISTNDLKVLLGHYGIAADDRVKELIELARAARERSWWNMYKDVASPRLLQYTEYEAAAMIARNFEPLLIPGLLQTEEYAREVIKEFSRHPPKDRLDALLSLRLKRQKLLKRTEPPPWFSFSAGINHGMQGPFIVLEFPEAEDDDVLYLESTRGDLINRDDPEEILVYREIFEELRHMSLGEGSVEFLRGLLDRR